MRVVIDTSTLVSALLWTGPPHMLITAAERGRITVYTSLALIDELAGVLTREKFSTRLHVLSTTSDEVISGFVQLAHLILPPPIPPVILDDPDDDAVLACAVAAHASYMISSDRHLLSLKHYQGIPILPPVSFLADVVRHLS